MSERAAALVRHRGTRLPGDALVASVLEELGARWIDVEQCALDGLRRRSRSP